MAERAKMTPTPQAQAILDFTHSYQHNLMVQSRAGTGKTTLLEQIDAATKGPNLYLCFNKANAIEAEDRVKLSTTVRSFNSLGHRVWAAACGKKLSLNKDKQREIFKLLADKA